MRIDIRRIESLKNGGEVVATAPELRLSKIRSPLPSKRRSLTLSTVRAFRKIGEIIDLGVKLELIDKGGAWFTVGETRLQGKEAVKDYLKENPEVCDELERKIRENFAKLISPQGKVEAKAAGRAVDVSADDFEG